MKGHRDTHHRLLLGFVSFAEKLATSELLELCFMGTDKPSENSSVIILVVLGPHVKGTFSHSPFLSQ